MKNILAIAVLGATLAFPGALHAQYSISWYTVAGGGGVSSGTNGSTNYTINGTIGQPATATMSGGSYSVTSGFWSIISVVQTPGSPTLSISRSGSQAIISWSASSTPFVLQETSNLSGSWAASGATQTTNSGIISVTVPAGSGYQYYRLYYP
jgi:opacity protein-like surface antigen